MYIIWSFCFNFNKLEWHICHLIWSHRIVLVGGLILRNIINEDMLTFHLFTCFSHVYICDLFVLLVCICVLWMTMCKRSPAIVLIKQVQRISKLQNFKLKEMCETSIHIICLSEDWCMFNIHLLPYMDYFVCIHVCMYAWIKVC